MALHVDITVRKMFVLCYKFVQRDYEVFADSQKLINLLKYRLPISFTKPWDQFTSKNPNLQLVVGKFAQPNYFFGSVEIFRHT